MRAFLPLLLALACCATTGAPPPAPERTVAVFAAAVEEGRFHEAWRLLSPRWRASLSPAELEADWSAGGALAEAALDRALAIRGAAPAREGDALVWRVAEGRELRLVREAGAWRLDALP